MNLIRNVRVISPDIDYKYANIILDGEYIKSVTEKEVNPELTRMFRDGKKAS